MIGNGRPGQSNFDAIITNDIKNELVFSKECLFSISKRFTCPASISLYFVFDTTNVDCDYLVLNPIIIQGFGAGPLNIDVHAGITENEPPGGTVIPIFNRNMDSTNVPKVSIRQQLSLPGYGLKLPPEFMVPSDGIPATAVLGGQSGDLLVTNLTKGIKYAFKITNLDSNDASCVIALNWFEYYM